MISKLVNYDGTIRILKPDCNMLPEVYCQRLPYYLFSAPAPTLTIISAPAPATATATAMYWNFTLLIEIEISLSSS